MARWTFVRHGETRANAERWLSGWVDVGLTERGRGQARRAGEALAGQGYAQRWVSDLRRARQTARVMSEPLALTEGDWRASPALRERTLGRWEGASLDGLRASGEMGRLLSWRGRAPGGESQHDLALRAVGFLASLDSVDTLIVSHGGVIRGLLGLVDGVDVEQIGVHRIANGVPHNREIESGRWTEILQALHYLEKTDR